MEKTALLLIEFQNDFVKEEGAMKATGIWKRVKEHNTTGKVVRVVEAARRAGMPIIHAPISFRQGYPEIARPFGLIKGVVDAKAFVKGTKGVEIINELKPRDGEYVIEKRRLCAFCDSELESLLHNLGIENLIISGFITNWCVEQTGREAYDKGFKPIFLTDCMEALTDEEQKFAVEKIFPAIGEIKTSEEITKQIEK